jgi:hypothetical protein
MVSGPNQENGQAAKPKDNSRAALLERLRQPLAAASNYIGAARLLIADIESPSGARAVALLAKGEKELLRAGDIIGSLSAGPEESDGAPAEL